MERKISKIILTLIMLLPIFISAKSTDMAVDLINENNKCSVKVHYNDYEFDSTNVNLYYVADISSSNQYTLTSDFSTLSSQITELNNVNRFMSQENWNDLRNTLSPYILTINPHMSGQTINNEITFNDLNCGLYYITTDKIENDKFNVSYESFFVNLPDIDVDNKWNYDVIAYPKVVSYYEKYSVIKEWIDNGNDRPNSININLYKDGIFYEMVQLNSSNNWTYNWIGDGKSKWEVLEEVPRNYSVSIKVNNNNFIVVNTKEELNPKTLDNINMFVYLALISLIGIILSMISIYINKKEK